MSTRAKRGAPAAEEAPATKKTKEETTAEDSVQAAVAAAENMAAKEKLSLAAQIDLSNKSHTDPAFFNDYFFALMAHKADTNNFHVSREDNSNLHMWLQHLKREYKNFLSGEVGTTLTDVQVKVLESVHVPLTSRGEDHWNRFYQLLQAYADRHGHVLVPRLCEIPGLGDWVTDQRRQYKAWKQGQASQLTKERREKLEAVGFAWQVRNRPEWEQRFSELAKYKEDHGDCKVPQHYKANKALGKWVAKQREQHKLLRKGQHSFLTPYRLEKLNSIGFVWSVRNSIDGNAEEEVKLSESVPGVLPAAAAPAAAAAALAIAQAAKTEDTKKEDVATTEV